MDDSRSGVSTNPAATGNAAPDTTAEQPPPITAAAMAGCLFGLSFGTALFALAVFKLLSFFVMPSLLFDLLFVGFPVGAMVGAWAIAEGHRPFVRSLWALQAIMAASVLAGLLAKRLDYLRAHLFDVKLPLLIGQVAAFIGLFLPFFAAYGLCEFLGYRLGRRLLGGRTRSAYALALFGAAAAYAFFKAALPPLGMARVLLCAFAALALATWLLAGPAGRRSALIELGLLALAGVLPGGEAAFLGLYKGHGELSTWDYETRLGCRTVYQRWGRYSLCEILADPARANYYGFYNDLFQWEYAPKRGFAAPSLGASPLLHTRPGDRIAIVGAGGGRQVRLAERLGGRKIVALELEPAVFEAVRSDQYLLRAFGRVYEAPGVTPVCAEARGYFERSRERFDLIYLPSVGGYAQMMIEPGNMVRTFEAYRLMRDRLSDRGVLAIWYPRGLDPQEVLTDQYVRTLRSLGLRAASYSNAVEFLILGYRDLLAEPPAPEALRRELTLEDPALAPYWPKRRVVADDPRFTPITDDKPFLAGNVRHILTLAQVRRLFGAAAGALGMAAATTWFALRRRGDPGIPDRSLPAVAGLSLLIGANFVLVEHLLVLALFRRTFVYEDSLALGAVGCLTLTGLGSLFAGRRLRPVTLALGAAALVALLGWPEDVTAAGALGLLAPVMLATGTFFPALFDRAAANPVAVFALDAVGAGFGALAATFVPILWGFDVFFALAAGVFVLTAAADGWFHAPLRKP